MAGDPTDNRYKQGAETGAYRLAAIGLSVLPPLRDPTSGAEAVTIPGATANGGLQLHWPIWTEPTSLASIRALLLHPGLPHRGALGHLGVAAAYRSVVVKLGKFKSMAPGTLV
jgi:hypothetical protein